MTIRKLRGMTSKMEHISEHLTPTTVYYCNCCGCTFKPNDSEIENDDIHCPECGCIYDEENEFIEKSIVYR